MQLLKFQVFVGRAALAGLSVAGEEGVTKVLEILKSELDLTMALSGRKNNQFRPRYT